MSNGLNHTFAHALAVTDPYLRRNRAIGRPQLALLIRLHAARRLGYHLDTDCASSEIGTKDVKCDETKRAVGIDNVLVFYIKE